MITINLIQQLSSEDKATLSRLPELKLCKNSTQIFVPDTRTIFVRKRWGISSIHYRGEIIAELRVRNDSSFQAKTVWLYKDRIDKALKMSPDMLARCKKMDKDFSARQKAISAGDFDMLITVPKDELRWDEAALLSKISFTVQGSPKLRILSMRGQEVVNAFKEQVDIITDIHEYVTWYSPSQEITDDDGFIDAKRLLKSLLDGQEELTKDLTELQRRSYYLIARGKPVSAEFAEPDWDKLAARKAGQTRKKLSL